MAKITSVEPTPNPLAFKLKLDQKVTTGAAVNYAKKDEAWENPLALKFFDIHGVDSIFFMDDLITISKTPGGIWDYIFFQTNEILMAAKDIAPIGPVGGEAATGAVMVGEFDTLALEEKLAVINKVIDESIRPGLARDGGGLEVLGLSDNRVKIRYQGACGSCPSSTAGTLNYIATLLQNKVSPRLTVMPV